MEQGLEAALNACVWKFALNRLLVYSDNSMRRAHVVWWRFYPPPQKYSVYISGLLVLPRLRLLCVFACSKVAAGCAGHYKWLAFRAR